MLWIVPVRCTAMPMLMDCLFFFCSSKEGFSPGRELDNELIFNAYLPHITSAVPLIIKNSIVTMVARRRWAGKAMNEDDMACASHILKLQIVQRGEWDAIDASECFALFFFETFILFNVAFRWITNKLWVWYWLMSIEFMVCGNSITVWRSHCLQFLIFCFTWNNIRIVFGACSFRRSISLLLACLVHCLQHVLTTWLLPTGFSICHRLVCQQPSTLAAVSCTQNGPVAFTSSHDCVYCLSWNTLLPVLLLPSRYAPASCLTKT